MLIKGKRSFDSLMNAISRHLTQEGDWEMNEDDDPEGPRAIFGDGEWTALLCYNTKQESVVYGVELFTDSYNDVELAVVEKAIALLEGVEWSSETSVDKIPERKRKKLKSVRDNGQRVEAEE